MSVVMVVAAAGVAGRLIVVVVMLVTQADVTGRLVVAVLVLIVVLMVVVVMVVVVMVVVVMAAGAALAVLVVVMVVLLIPAVAVADLLHQLLRQGAAALHGGHDLVAGELLPGGGEDGRLGILVPQQAGGHIQLGLVHVLGAGEEDGGGVLHLIVEELTEILHIDLGLGGVHHGDKAVEPEGGGLLLHPLHGGDDVGQLPHAGGLDDDAVRGVVGQHLLQSGAEVAHQRAADAAGVHLGDLHTGVLEKTAVDADLAELVFNEDDLLAVEGLVQQLLDEGGLAGSQEAGDNVDLCHSIAISFLKVK